jgi:type IV fimbrial biogenesis protein FimT
MPAFNKALGFTLIELLIALSLASTVIGVFIVPAYFQWLRNAQLEIKARQLFATLQFARSLAMQQRIPVTVCPSDNRKSCGGNWREGWIVLMHAADGVPQVARIDSGLFPRQSLIWKGARGITAVQLRPFGTSAGHNGRFVLCAKDSKIAWMVFVSHTGRLRLECSRDLLGCASFTLSN